jgi:nicotinate-nucleotide adenylyltransferase
VATATSARDDVPSIGILGGTFNPPHVGHLLCAQEAYDRLGLDRVVLMPVHTPPHKESWGDPGPEERVALCRAAVDGDARFAVSTAETDAPGPSYTAETLRRLRGTAPGDELTFIVGGDMAASLPTWREPEEILRLARVAVAERAGATRADIAERLQPLGGAGRITFFDLPRVDVSSTDVRRRVSEGRPIRWLVPDAVAERIAARGLYRTGATA